MNHTFLNVSIKKSIGQFISVIVNAVQQNACRRLVNLTLTMLTELTNNTLDRVEVSTVPLF